MLTVWEPFRAMPFASTPVVQSAEERDASVMVLGAGGRTGTGLVSMGAVAAAEHTVRPALIVQAAPPRRSG